MTTIRPEVQWFAEQMENKLKHHDAKGHWNDCDIDWLFTRVQDEIIELLEAIDLHKQGEGTSEEIIKEAADVANFVMMIADIVNEK